MTYDDLDNQQCIIVASEDVGTRIDTFLVDIFPDITRSQIKRWIENVHIHVNEHECKVSYKIREGDRINLNPPAIMDSNIEPENIPLTIIYEDNDIVVVDKSIGLVIHPAPGHYTGTLANAIMYHAADLTGIAGEHKPGIVHRLDKDTSGVIVIAKNDMAYQSLCAQFKNRSVEKIYYALVFGSFSAGHGTIDLPIGRSKHDRKRMSSQTSMGRNAMTEWFMDQRFGKVLSWLKVILHTGRTHQIRVHMSESHHPIVGDPLYGGQKKSKCIGDKLIRQWVDAIDRPMLHAYSLCIDHPKTNERMVFCAPFPDDITTILSQLKTHFE